MRLGLSAIALLVAVGASLSACGENPFTAGDAVILSDTVKLAAPTADSANVGSALDVIFENAVRFPERVGDAGNWDVALRVEGGALVLRPITTQAGFVGSSVLTDARTYESIKSAPGSGAFADSINATQGNHTIPLEQGKTYLLRSRQYLETGVGVCVRYAKISAVEVNAAAATARFAVTSNGICNDRRLNP